jgi:Flp pilus assembly pilin Flp
MNLKKSFLTLVKDERGAELAEYAVGVALLVAIGIVVYKVLGDSINDSQSGTAAKVGSAVDDAGY